MQKSDEGDSYMFLVLKQGILSTERGQRAILSFDSYERSLIEVMLFLDLIEEIVFILTLQY